MKKKKIILATLFLIFCIALSFAFVSCGNNTENSENDNPTTEAPIAGKFTLESPTFISDLNIVQMEFQFYLDGTVRVSGYYTIIGTSDIKREVISGVYLWKNNTAVVHLLFSDDPNDIITFNYTGDYVGADTLNCKLVGPNDKGEFDGQMALVRYNIENHIDKYQVDGGSIVGDIYQFVRKGENASTVTAVANDGFIFDGWTDGVLTEERQDLSVDSNITVAARFKQVEDIFLFEYTAEEGGSLTGETSQYVVAGKTGSTVFAVPDDGYEFIGWSDGVMDAERSDTSFTSDISVTAKFIPIGTEDNPYRITTVEELRAIETHPNAHYKLLNDIYIADGYDFAPLLSKDTPFNGIFDGNGYTISNLTINGNENEYNGLFAYIGADGCVKNLSLEDVKLSGGGSVGGIAGYSGGAISGCTVNGEFIDNGYNVYRIGGIAGYVEGTLENCNTVLDVTISINNEISDFEIGGIAGYAEGTFTDISSQINFTIDSSGTISAGGLFGYLKGVASESNSAGSLNITANQISKVGGLIGELLGSAKNAYSSCNIVINAQNSDIYAGGFVGNSIFEEGHGFGLEISNCYAQGDITVSSNANVYAGGFVGGTTSGIITQCFATGNIDASGNALRIGGLIGWGDSDISACYSLSNISAKDADTLYLGGLVGSGTSFNNEISNSYTISQIIYEDGYNELSVGGIIGWIYDEYNITINNNHWLDFGNVKTVTGKGDFALWENNIKHTAASDFCNLADQLNDGLSSPAFEDTGSNNLTSLINTGEAIPLPPDLPETTSYTLSYSAGDGGTIDGETTQIVLEGESGTTVIAVPNEGYEFVGWSDGIITAERTDENIADNISVIALFELKGASLFAGGNGTIDDPYQINEVRHLRNINLYPNASYKLIGNIILPEVAIGQSNFTPLCSDETMFNGILDGNGYTILNLTIYNTNNFYTGLFACVGQNASIRNLTLENADLNGINYIGGIAAYSLGSITDCHVSGKITYLSKNDYKVFLGGIAGRGENDLNGCTADVLITVQEIGSELYVGGIVGYYAFDMRNTDKNLTITANATINITAKENGNTIHAGGAIGYSEETLKLLDSYATGDISVKGNRDIYAGGLVGNFGDYGNDFINCCATSNVSVNGGSRVHVGGLVGFLGSSCNLINCYATGNVSVNGGNDVSAGGLVGYSIGGIDLTNCYATGDVSVNSENYVDTGGLVGSSDEISVSNCYSVSKITCKETTGQVYLGGVVGYAGKITLTNAHWLYFAKSGVEYSVGYSNSLGIPTNIGATKHTAISEFYTLADTLNEGLETPAWEHVSENALPTLIENKTRSNFYDNKKFD